jgi:hypothetical protein
MLITQEVLESFKALPNEQKRGFVEDLFLDSANADNPLSLRFLGLCFCDNDKGTRDISARILLSNDVLFSPAEKGSAIIDLITHKRIEVRNLAADSLVRCGDSIFESLSSYGTHEDSEVRKMVCEIVSAIGSLRLAAVVRPLLHDLNHNVICAAIEAVGAIGDTDSVETLIEIFSSMDITQPYVLDALGKISSHEAEEFIIAQIRSEDNFLQVSAITALSECSRSVNLATKLLSIIELAPEDIQPMLIHTVYAIAIRAEVNIVPPPTLRSLYLRMMTGENQDYRIAGIWAMREECTTAEIDVLRTMFFRGSEAERSIIFSILAHSTDATVLGEFVRAVFATSLDYETVESIMQNVRENWQEISQFADSTLHQVFIDFHEVVPEDFQPIMSSFLSMKT